MTVGDADELAVVLGDPRLHEFIGGRPDSPAELRERYRRWVAGSGIERMTWLNWVVRLDGVAVGTVQASVETAPDGHRSAHVAWVIGIAWQGRGYAAEAATALVEWLRDLGIDDIRANIHPGHHASAAAARRAGLHPTVERNDGETVWRRPYDT